MALFFADHLRGVVQRYGSRPGVRPLIVGILVLLASYFLMRWYDPLGDAGKFSGFGDAVDRTPAIAPFARIFFGWLWWVALVVVAVATFVAIARRLRWLGSGQRRAVGRPRCRGRSSPTRRPPPSPVGSTTRSVRRRRCIGYLILASAGVIAARSDAETAATRDFIERVMGFRPGLPLVAMGLLLGLLALFTATWFDRGGKNADPRRHAAPLRRLDRVRAWRRRYLSWLGYVLFAVVLVLSAPSRCGPAGARSG